MAATQHKLNMLCAFIFSLCLQLSCSSQPLDNSDTAEPYFGHGILKTQVELNQYEKMWHMEIFQATWGELPTMVLLVLILHINYNIISAAL